MSDHLRKYGVATTIPVKLFEIDGVDLRVDAVHAAGDVKITKDEGAEANTASGFADEGSMYSIALSATEMQAARISLIFIDQTATKVWLDTAITVETYGNASAQHALDLDDAVRGGMTALPNAAADAAGGLAISDAGGLDLDARLDAAVSSRLASADINLTAGVVDTVTTLTNLPAITTNWLTATGIAASALNGKGDWNTTTPPTAAAITDAVWDEAQSGHVSAGTFGKFLDVEVSSVSGGGGLTQQNVRDAMKLAPTAGSPTAGSVDEHLDDILTDTGTTLPATLTGMENKIDIVDTNVDQIETAVITNAAGVDVSADIAAVKVDTAAVKAKTDKLTYTSGNDLDANIQKVNDVVVTGTGATGTEWGP